MIDRLFAIYWPMFSQLKVLNTCFQTVAKTIRNMLAIVRDYAQKFPADVSKRILQAANEVSEIERYITLSVSSLIIRCDRILRA